MNISTDIHRVKSISMKTGKVSSGTVWTEFTFSTEDGELMVTAYSKDAITVEGSDHVNHVASGEPEPA